MTNESQGTVDLPRSVMRSGQKVHVSVSWLAQYWSVHPNTIYRDIGKGALPAFKLPGGQLRVRMSDALQYGRPLD